MSWQDALFAAGQIAFAIALLPSVFGRDKPAAWTSGATGAVLAMFAVAYASLGLTWAAASCAVCAATWLVLLWQKLFRP